MYYIKTFFYHCRLDDECALKRSISDPTDDELKSSRRGQASTRRSFFRRRRHQRNNSMDSRELSSYSDVSINSDSSPCLDGQWIIYWNWKLRQFFFFFRILSHFYVGLMFLMRFLPWQDCLSEMSFLTFSNHLTLSSVFLSFFPPAPSSPSLSCLCILLNTCPLQPTFLHFLRYFSHLRCPSNFFNPEGQHRWEKYPRQYPAIYTNYNWSNCTISNKIDFNRSSDFLRTLLLFWHLDQQRLQSMPWWAVTSVKANIETISSNIHQLRLMKLTAPFHRCFCCHHDCGWCTRW